jgi:hypothetical protein
VPQASITARLVSCQLPGPLTDGRAIGRWLGRWRGGMRWPIPAHSPSQTALDRRTQRSSPVPGGSARSRERSAKYS